MARLKVLIAEDEPVSLRLMEASLLNWGYDAVAAQDGEQAQEALRHGGIHICMLDWEMPKINGIKLCRWIRKSCLTPEPYIIMLTSRKAPEDIQAGHDAGVDKYIPKPFDRTLLRSLLSEVANGGHLQAIAGVNASAATRNVI